MFTSHLAVCVCVQITVNVYLVRRSKAAAMFSRKSANVLSKDSGATSPSDAPPSTAAVGSVLNSGLSFALMEERACVSLLHKLSGTHLEGVYGVWSVVHCGPFSVRGGRGGTRRGIG